LSALTIIHSSHLGFAYLAWLGVVFLFLCDKVFNRARVTTEMINRIFSAVGSAFSVFPLLAPNGCLLPFN